MIFVPHGQDILDRDADLGERSSQFAQVVDGPADFLFPLSIARHQSRYRLAVARYLDDLAALDIAENSRKLCFEFGSLNSFHDIDQSF